jgi:hypothetical protein
VTIATRWSVPLIGFGLADPTAAIGPRLGIMARARPL